MSELAARVEQFADAHGCVGIAVGLIRAGQPVTTINRGVASLGDRVPIDSRSVFRAGSISKLFTGIAVMQLVEEGTLELDEPANTHLDRFELRTPANGTGITLRHLLTHTSGIGELRRATDLFRPVIGMASEPGRPIPDLGDYYAPALSARQPAGERWAYANHGFATLGAIVEDVTGESFAIRVRRTILDPLGMDHSDFTRTERVSARLVDGHAALFGRSRRVDDRDIIPAPAGSLFTCVDDLARFVTMMGGDGPQVLSRALLDEMVTPQWRIHPALAAMGLAFMVDDVADTQTVMHDGGLPGFVSHVRVATAGGVGVVILTNSASTAIGMDIAGFGKDLIDDATGATVERAVPIPNHRDRWHELSGAYRLEPGLNSNARAWMLLGGEVEVMVRDDTLMLRSFTGPARIACRLRPVDPNDPLVFEFTVGESTIRVAFGTDVIHIGLPLNVTLHRRTRGFRKRARLAAGGVLAAASAAVALQLVTARTHPDR